MPLPSYINVNDGTTSIDIPGEASLNLQIRFSHLGEDLDVERLNGIGLKHCFYTKQRIQISAEGPVSPGLGAIDWVAPITLTVPLVDGTPTQFFVFATRPTERYDHSTAKIQWTLNCEER